MTAMDPKVTRVDSLERSDGADRRADLLPANRDTVLEVSFYKSHSISRWIICVGQANIR